MSQTTRPTCDRAHQLTNSMQRKLGENRVSRILRVQPGLFSSFQRPRHLAITRYIAQRYLDISPCTPPAEYSPVWYASHVHLAGLQHATKRTPNYMQNSKLDMQIQNIKITANIHPLILILLQCGSCAAAGRNKATSPHRG
jgi:hypothetical protein